MTGLTSVKLPLKLAQNSGIARDAFKGCTGLQAIEFDFTTASASTNLNANRLGESDDSAVTALANIYKMFAGGDDSFGDNTQIEDSTNAPAKTTWWLPVAGDNIKGIFHAKNGATPANFTSTLNGIK